MGAEAPVWVVSTGRAGSTSVSRTATRHFGVDLGHQTRGSRRINLLGNWAWSGQLSLGLAERLAESAAGTDWDRSTADPLKSVMLALRVLARPESFRHVTVCHLTRSPHAFVRSFLRWSRMTPRRRFLHRAVPQWQPHPRWGDGRLETWKIREKADQFYWVWYAKNRLFQDLLAAHRGPAARLRIEDLTEGNSGVRLIGRALGLAEPQAAVTGVDRRNASSASSGPPITLEPPTSPGFAALCSELGYSPGLEVES